MEQGKQASKAVRQWDRSGKESSLKKHREQLARHAPSPTPSEDVKDLTPHEIRRRAQNRASQRAFRERKRSQTESLEQKVLEMQQIHDELLQLYQHKEEEVSALYGKIHDLEHKLQLLKRPTSAAPNHQSHPPFQFEPVVFDDPYDRWPTTLLQTPLSWDAQFAPADAGFGETSLLQAL